MGYSVAGSLGHADGGSPAKLLGEGGQALVAWAEGAEAGAGQRPARRGP